LGRAQAELVRARVAFCASAENTAELLFTAARRLEPLDIDLARETYLDALGASVHLGPQECYDSVEVAHAALRARRAGPPRPTDLLLDGVALRLTQGYAAAVPTLRQALDAFSGDDIADDTLLAWGGHASHVAAALWEHDIQHALAERHTRLARDVGALALVSHTLSQLVGVHLREGELAKAEALAREADGDSTLIAAYRGEAPRGRAPLASLIFNNGLGRYDEAVRDGRGALDELDPAWALPELVEAAARAEDAELARAALERLIETTRPCGTDVALGIEARSRALLSDGAAAEALYREAIDRLGRTRLRPDLARAHLLYGEWLRRERRRVDAREPLRSAHELFESIGMEAFAERARHELQASGERVRKRSVETRDDLTAQERQIASLARDGLSNPQIGKQLFLSPRTVEWHLRNVFTKLGIRSRRELAGALT
jgi:DNA-binding CsgD family transcriptional regulator